MKKSCGKQWYEYLYSIIMVGACFGGCLQRPDARRAHNTVDYGGNVRWPQAG